LKYLTIQETAALLGKSPLTVRTWAKQGTIPAFQPVRGGRWLVDASAIEKITQPKGENK